MPSSGSCPRPHPLPSLHQPHSPPVVDKLLGKMGDVGAEFGCPLTWVYYPQDQDLKA